MPERLTNRRRGRRVAAVAVVGLLIAFAGCSGLGGSPPGDATTDETTTEGPATTTTESGATPTTDSDDTAANESTDATATNDTAGTTAANGGADSSAGDGNSHSHGDGHSHGETTTDSTGGDDANDSTSGDESADGTTTADGNGSTNESATNESTQLSGKMTVVVAATELPLDELATGDRVSIAPDDEHTWRASSELTLAEALATFGVDANATSLTYNGTTYREATNGTTVSVRVDGEPVDPESYTLQDGDQVWVTVETADANYSVPGEYIPPDQQHIHGPMEFLVDGEEVDFAAERFQSGHDNHFHFEGGRADPWHAHSWSVTLQYGMNTLPGINVTEDAVTYNGTTYNRGAANETVSITVNGEPVDPSEYLLKDGDAVRIVVESDES